MFLLHVWSSLVLSNLKTVFKVAKVVCVKTWSCLFGKVAIKAKISLIVHLTPGRKISRFTYCICMQQIYNLHFKRNLSHLELLIGHVDAK